MTAEIISLILNAVLGSGIVGMFMFYNARRRKKNAEAESAEIHNEQTEVDRLEARLKVRDDKIDAIYTDYRSLQTDHVELLKRYHILEIQKMESDMRRCQMRGCTNREPQSDY